MKRENWIDYLKVFGIFLIVWGHFFPPYISIFIYSINVPIFFFISGYLFNDSDARTLSRKIVKTLVVPYVILTSINLIINMSLNIFEIEDNSLYVSYCLPRAILGILLGCHNVQGVPAAGTLWFVYDLVLIKILDHFALKYKLIKHLLCMMVFAIAIFISRITEPITTISPILSLPIAYLFFEFGRIFKNIAKTFFSMSKWARIAIAFVIIPIYYFAVRNNGVAFLYEGKLGNSSLKFFISSISAILICVLIFTSMPFKQNPFVYLSSIGTIVTLAIHMWLIKIAESNFISCDSTTLGYVIVSLILSIIILFVCHIIIIITKRYFPIVLGDRK